MSALTYCVLASFLFQACWMLSSLNIFTLTCVSFNKFLLTQGHKWCIRKINCDVSSRIFIVWGATFSSMNHLRTMFSTMWFSLCPWGYTLSQSRWSHAPMGYPPRFCQTISTPLTAGQQGLHNHHQLIKSHSPWDCRYSPSSRLWREGELLTLRFSVGGDMRSHCPSEQCLEFSVDTEPMWQW